jgi:quercetin dioxygenase-like cupin family protein/hemerythrin-like domain-containing protein
MKRHPALVPLSHDHHHALVEARALSRGADGDEAERLAAVSALLRFFSTDTIAHFREEEERLFPALVDAGGEARELLAQALLEHQRMHALAARLERGLAAGRAEAASMRELAQLLHAHVRLEERRLFPLIQELLSDEALARLELSAAPPAGSPVVDLSAPQGTGPLWGTETDDLNATLLSWPAAEGPDEHVNTERDVLWIVLDGTATVTVDGQPHELGAAQAITIEKGSRRGLSAGPGGVRYLSVHRRRAPLQIAPRDDGPQT